MGGGFFFRKAGGRTTAPKKVQPLNAVIPIVSESWRWFLDAEELAERLKPT